MAIAQSRQFAVAIAIGDERCQHRRLALGPQHRFVGAIEIVKVVEQPLDAITGVAGIEHVVAHELGEVADRLHRDGLVE